MEDTPGNKKKIQKFFPGLLALKEIYRPGSKAGRFLSVVTLTGIAYGLYGGIQNNYLAEIAGITASGRGIVEFFRELPGLLVVVLLAWMYRLRNSAIFKLGIVIMGIAAIGLLPGFTGKFIVVLFMVIYSVGEHIIMPVRTSISLEMARENQGGSSLGITSGIYHGGQIGGFVIVTALFFIFSRMGFSRTALIPFQSIYGLTVILLLGAFLCSLGLKDASNTVSRQRFYFSKKFSKYYMLEVFYGARKQIFITFAPYVLILHYGADTSVVALLMAVCAAAGMIFGPLIGRLTDKLGYKTIMVTDTLILMVVCFFYGFAHRIFPPGIAYIVVCVNYVLDSIISLASMASNLYVQDIAESPEEITATVSTGISVNHFISIFIALIGGWIWEITGIEVLFSLSAFLGLLNTIYAATIKIKKPLSAS